MPPAPPKDDDGFRVTPWVDVLGGFIARRRGLWIGLGNLESRLLADELAATPIDRPIYVSGLARSGTTKMLEVLAAHPDVATHRYKDYPPVFTPYWWNRLLERTPQHDAAAVERSHKDGILVTPDSPEALEEVLWMAFFPHLHDPATSNVLDARAANPAFEAFYRDHVRKLLRVRGRARYLSKGNYNVTRLDYLLKLFPDARLVVPVRAPVWHVASLAKQQALFCAGLRRHPKALRHLQRVGHFEFGLDRRPINAGDGDHVAQIQGLWQQGAEVEGWARYWSHVYGFVADRLDADPRLRDAALVVRYEDLCRSPRETLRAVLAHCDLPGADAIADRAAGTIRFPSYYRPGFTPDELDLIDRCTRATAARFGYTGAEVDPPPHPAPVRPT